MTSPHLSLRIDLPNGQRFGPGKAALLAAIDDADGDTYPDLLVGDDPTYLFLGGGY